jgi:hypothetical protein
MNIINFTCIGIEKPSLLVGHTKAGPKKAIAGNQCEREDYMASRKQYIKGFI